VLGIHVILPNSRRRQRLVVAVGTLSVVLVLIFGSLGPVWVNSRPAVTLSKTVTSYQTVTTTKILSPFLHADGNLIVDAYDSPVWLHGANIASFEHANFDDYKNIAILGFNVVRLPVYWSGIEPTPRHYDEKYLQRIDENVRWAKSLGLYVVIDIHQYYWAYRFPTPDGWNGSGLPDWAVTGFPGTEAGRNAAITMFWSNTTLRGSFDRLWQLIASRYQNETSVAGYDLLNEPLAGNIPVRQFTTSILPSFYGEVISAIRKVDSHHLIFYESSLDALYTPVFVNAYNTAYSPHFYMFSFSNFYNETWQNGLEPQVMNGTFQMQIANVTVPIWVGEFGTQLKMPGWQGWVKQTLQVFAQHKVGWSWWCYQRDDSPSFALAYQNGTLKTELTSLLTNPSTITTLSPAQCVNCTISALDVSKH